MNRKIYIMFPDGKNLRALIFFHDSISPYLLQWKFSNKNQKTKERRFVKRFFILSYRRPSASIFG